jgi:hypothetical protein
MALEVQNRHQWLRTAATVDPSNSKQWQKVVQFGFWVSSYSTAGGSCYKTSNRHRYVQASQCHVAGRLVKPYAQWTWSVNAVTPQLLACSVDQLRYTCFALLPFAECHAPCWWPYKPVCGKDGKTYANECRAACKGIEIVSQGGCRVRGKNGGWFGRKPGG